MHQGNSRKFEQNCTEKKINEHRRQVDILLLNGVTKRRQDNNVSADSFSTTFKMQILRDNFTALHKFKALRRFDSFEAKSLNLRNTFFRCYLVNTRQNEAIFI